jgi:hypothetical protein
MGERFDRTFDALLVGVIDGVSGGRVSKVRRVVRDVVEPAQMLRPFAADLLREIADSLDPPPKRGRVKDGRRQRP